MSHWKTVASRTVLDGGRWLSVEMRTVETPTGKRIEDWAWVTTPDFVNVVPVNAAGNLLLFRQDKYALEGESLAPVGGYLEPDEDPRAAAERELYEEMGCTAGAWMSLGSYRVDPNRGVAVGHLFLALSVRKVAEPDADDLETLRPVELSAAEVDAALRAGEVPVLSWAFALTQAVRWLEGWKA